MVFIFFVVFTTETALNVASRFESFKINWLSNLCNLLGLIWTLLAYIDRTRLHCFKWSFEASQCSRSIYSWLILNLALKNSFWSFLILSDPFWFHAWIVQSLRCRQGQIFNFSLVKLPLYPFPEFFNHFRVSNGNAHPVNNNHSCITWQTDFSPTSVSK